MSENSREGIREYQRLFGQATHDDQQLFELLVVAVFQAGLSWRVAAGKLPVFRRVFANFEISRVAAFDEPEIEKLMQDPEMIRNPRKIRAIVSNARAICQLPPEFSDFATYLWHFTEQEVWRMSVEPDVPLNQPSSLGTAVAKDMKKRGFKFIGPTTTQLLLLAAGIIQRV